MLILHTADLHLGKTIHERDLLEDQAFALDAIVEAAAKRRPAALLVAGDIYDRSIPTPEAIRLFDSFLNRVVEASPGIAIVVVPGNHDSAARLSFGASLLKRANVHFRTVAEDCIEPIVVERDGERMAIWALPFLGPGAFSGAEGTFFDEVSAEEEPGGTRAGTEAGAYAAVAGQGELAFDEVADSDREPLCVVPRSQAELFSRAVRGMESCMRALRDAASYNVLVAHCFAAGGRTAESERAFVGRSEQVDAALVEVFDYAALGHLHRAQAVGARGRYSGSPLAYSFAEGDDDKGFLAVELSRGRADVELVRITPRRAMRRVEGPFSVLAAPGAFPEIGEDYVEARLTDAAPVLNPADPLRANFPNLLSVRQAAFELAALGGGDSLHGMSEAPDSRLSCSGGAASVAADFAAFYAEMRGAAPDSDTAAIFDALLAEAEREAL